MHPVAILFRLLISVLHVESEFCNEKARGGLWKDFAPKEMFRTERTKRVYSQRADLRNDLA